MRTQNLINLSGGITNERNRPPQIGSSIRAGIKIHNQNNKVQTKLKKLIGSKKNRSKEFKMGYTKFSRNENNLSYKKKGNVNKSLNQRDKKTSSISRKRNRSNFYIDSVLDLSSDSIKKRSEKVDQILKGRFPITTPNKYLKGKKLFGVASNKKEEKLKDHSKKNKTIYDVLKSNKAISNTALAKTLKYKYKNNSNLGFSTKSISKLRKKSKSKNYSSKNKEGKLGSVKGNTFKNYGAIGNNSLISKLEKSPKKEQMLNYLKNNFFVKNSYLQKQKNEKPKSNTQHIDQNNSMANSGVQNKTGDNGYSNKIRVKRGLKDINFSNLIRVERFLFDLRKITHADFEIYDLVKEYVDHIQEEDFSVYFKDLSNQNLKRILKNLLLIERWAMFFIFFFYFDENELSRNKTKLKQISVYLHENCLFLIAFWSLIIEEKGASKSKWLILQSIIKKRQKEFQDIYAITNLDMTPIVKKCNYVITIFKRL